MGTSQDRDTTNRQPRQRQSDQVEAASVRDVQEPKQGIDQALPQVPEEGVLTPPRMAVGAPRPGVPRDEDPVDADELGAHFLRGAVQDPRLREPESKLPAEEDLSLSEGEERMLEELVREYESQPGLVTEMPYRGDQERDVSASSREAVLWARRQGAQSHEEVRKRAWEYLTQRGEQASGRGVADETEEEEADERPRR